MNTLPPITIVICTYDRPDEIRKVLTSLSKNLLYPNLHLHIADDGTRNSEGSNYDYIESLLSFALDLEWYNKHKLIGVQYSVTNRQGWGTNVNKALSLVKDKIIYFTEDDYVLQEPIDLTKWVLLLEKRLDIGMVRFGIEGHTGLVTMLREATIQDEKLQLLEILLDQAGSSFGAYKYSNRPHLRHVRFSKFYGKYIEGEKLGKTEEIMNTQISDRYKASPHTAPRIVCPFDHLYFKYDHIGHSRQHTAEDI